MSRLAAACACAIVVLGAIAFFNSLGAPFVYDDHAAVRDNQTIRTIWPDALSPPATANPMAGRPLVNLSMAINYAIGGLEPRGYRVWNVAVHIACALLLFGVVRRTLLGRGGEAASTGLAMAAGSLWLLHPLDSEPVDHVTARTESMMAVCYLLTLYASIRAREVRSAVWGSLCVVACAAGMACKESMVTAPLMVLLYDRVFSNKTWNETLSRRWRLYVALALSWMVLLALNSSAPRGASAGLDADLGVVNAVSPWTYLLNQARLIPHYLRLAAWPSGLVFDYGVARPLTLSDVAPYFVGVVALLAIVVLAFAVRPMWGFLGAWFFLTLAPASSVVPIYTEVGAERRMYLPMMALTVTAVLVAYALGRRMQLSRRLGGIAATVALVSVAGALLTATTRRNSEYASGITLWQTVIDRWPHGRAHYNLAMELKAVGRTDESMTHLRESVKDYPDARSVLGIALLDRGTLDEGIRELRTFIDERPDHVNVVIAHGRIADALFGRGRYQEAIPEYREYLRHRSQIAGPWTNLGIALAATDSPSEAIVAFQRAAEIEPGNASARRNLANALLDAHEFGRAEEQAQLALRLSPSDAVARDILELALRGQKSAAPAARD
jgi:Flp pilus assembly protein TadD